MGVDVVMWDEHGHVQEGTKSQAAQAVSGSEAGKCEQQKCNQQLACGVSGTISQECWVFVSFRKERLRYLRGPYFKLPVQYSASQYLVLMVSDLC